MASIQTREVKRKLGSDGHKRKGKVYDVFYDYRNPASGKISRTSKKGFRTREEAVTFKNQKEKEIMQGIVVMNSRMKLGEYLDEWLSTVKFAKATNTFLNYNNVVNNHIKPFIGGLEIRQVESKDIRQLYEKLEKIRKLKPGTIIQSIKVLSTAFNSAIKQNIIVQNPVKQTSLPSVQKSSVKIYSFVDLVELMRLLEDTDLECPVSLAILTGMRLGEITGLTWKNIDFSSNTIHIVQQIAVNKDGYGFARLKTQNSIRSIKFSDVVNEILIKQKQRQADLKEKIGLGFNKDNLFCTTRDGNMFEPSYFSQKFSRKIKSLEIKKITFHGLRHSYATLMLIEDESIKVVSGLLGHAKIKTTADTYMHLVDKSKEKAAETINEIFKKQEVKKTRLKLIKMV